MNVSINRKWFIGILILLVVFSLALTFIFNQLNALDQNLTTTNQRTHPLSSMAYEMENNAAKISAHVLQTLTTQRTVKNLPLKRDLRNFEELLRRAQQKAVSDTTHRLLQQTERLFQHYRKQTNTLVSVHQRRTESMRRLESSFRTFHQLVLTKRESSSSFQAKQLIRWYDRLDDRMGAHVVRTMARISSPTGPNATSFKQKHLKTIKNLLKNPPPGVPVSISDPSARTILSASQNVLSNSDRLLSIQKNFKSNLKQYQHRRKRFDALLENRLQSHLTSQFN